MMKGALENLSKANRPDCGGVPTTASGASPASVTPDNGSAPLTRLNSAVNSAVYLMKSVVTAAPISVAVIA